MRNPFKRRPDQFRLDLGREVYIDGHPFIITRFAADSNYANLRNLCVDFQPPEDFVKGATE